MAIAVFMIGKLQVIWDWGFGVLGFGAWDFGI